MWSESILSKMGKGYIDSDLCVGRRFIHSDVCMWKWFIDLDLCIERGHVYDKIYVCEEGTLIQIFIYLCMQ